MAYFRHLEEQMQRLTALAVKGDRWLITINADPDALASAMALRHILTRKGCLVGIGQVNEIKRLDNLAMVRYLNIPTKRLIPNLIAQYDRFALVDSQPHHHPEFEKLTYSIIIDHHPLVPEKPARADYVEIKPEYGATATMLTEYLYTLKLRPPKLLATGLAFAIKADTLGFERKFVDADIKAFQYLSKYADFALIKRIVRSEYHLDWLRYFSRAFYTQRRIGQAVFAYVSRVDNPDVLVIIADFFTRVHGIPWVAVAGIYLDKLVIIFRGDGRRKNMGQFASCAFGDVGSAGGHRDAARAEIEIKHIQETDPEKFAAERLIKSCGIKRKKD